MWEKLCACAMMAFYAMVQPTITIDPLPPSAGQPCDVTYDGPLPVTLNVRTRPPGVLPATLDIGETGTATLNLPENITYLSLTDPTNGAEEEAVVVQ